MAITPKYLTGDSAAITEFIDKFDVSHFSRQQSIVLNADIIDRRFSSTAMVCP